VRRVRAGVVAARSWSTEFTVSSFDTFYADALAAGSDHALLRAITTLE
jgi:hypothetical protein